MSKKGGRGWELFDGHRAVVTTEGVKFARIGNPELNNYYLFTCSNNTTSQYVRSIVGFFFNDRGWLHAAFASPTMIFCVRRRFRGGGR